MPVSYVAGQKSSPIPSVRYGRGVSPEKTLPAGSAPRIVMSGLRSFR